MSTTINLSPAAPPQNRRRTLALGLVKLTRQEGTPATGQNPRLDLQVLGLVVVDDEPAPAAVTLTLE